MKVPIINLSREVLCCFEDSIRREWIITNGLGGYASSTVLGINTRKYHGLLVAAFHPPADRRVCLEKLDEEVEIKSNIYPLGANDYQNDIFPKGHQFLTEVTVSPFPRYVYTVQNVEIEKTVFMPREKNAVVTLYKVQNKNNFTIRIRVFPLVNWRHFHSVTSRWKISAEPIQQSEKNETRITLSEPKFALILRIIDGKYCQEGKWVEKIYYREEARRGESCLDDAYQPGFFEAAVEANRKEAFAVAAAAHENQETAQNTIDTMPANIYDMEGLYEKEMARHENFLTHFYETHSKLNASPWLSLIAIATDMFIVKAKNPEYNSVIAGYHWFESWGRDAFISLPGLALVTGKFENARKIFLNFKNHYKAGLIPNIIADSAQETLIYNSVDATLWFLHALLQYLKYTGDYKFVQDHLWNTLKDIVDSHMKGTDFNIHVDSDGLLSHGPQLTWMDTVVDGKPVTPRGGKAVEIQALWFNSLKIMELLAKKFKEAGKAEEYARMAEKAKKSFTENFWNEEKNCLYDAVSENEKDSTLRPNQIIAVFLDFNMLDNSRNEKIVDAVHREHLTPYGLRTLAKSDPRYRGVYEGNRTSRDLAYHNGTAWPWLLGPFTTAFLKTKGANDFRREYAMKNFLYPLFSKQILDAGLGTISEVFDGDPPHNPKGCISQAWSVAEPLRAYVEDIMQIRPKHEKEVLTLK